MSNNSLEASDAVGAAGAVAPRVSLASMEDKVAHVFFFTAGEAIHGAQIIREGLGAKSSLPLPVELLTICVIVLKNGWTLLGKSAPASPENFDADKGKHFAREDALRQLWPLEGYLLRDRLASEIPDVILRGGFEQRHAAGTQREIVTRDMGQHCWRNAKGDVVPDNEIVRQGDLHIRMVPDADLGGVSGKVLGHDRSEEGAPSFKG